MIRMATRVATYLQAERLATGGDRCVDLEADESIFIDYPSSLDGSQLDHTASRSFWHSYAESPGLQGRTPVGTRM